MRFSNIEVSGIAHIVFNRKTKWNLSKEAGHEGADAWFREIPEVMKLRCEAGDIGQCIMLHEQMMGIVNALKKDRRYRMWIHLDTLNIIRRTAKINFAPWKGEVQDVK